MRVAFVSYEYYLSSSKGGIGTYIYNISNLFYANGHDVEIFCSKTNAINEFEIHNGVRINYVRSESPVDFRVKVLSIFAERHINLPFDLIESPEVNADGLLIQQSFKDIPFITRMHTPNAIVIKYQQVYSPFLKKLRFVLGSIKRGKLDLGYWRKSAFEKEQDIEFLITNGSQAVSVPSESLKKWAINYWGIPKDKIAVIPNPVCSYKALEELPIDINTKNILYLGRLDILKGVVNLTKALKKVLKRVPEWKIIFAGSNAPSHLPNLTSKEYILRELNAFKENLIFYDSYSLDMLPKILKNCSICVLPSFYESFSYTCAESMIAGKAVIGSKSGGMVDLLGKGSAGILIDPNSSRDIKKAILYLINNPNIIKEFGLKARTRILEEYSSQYIYQQFEAFYKNAILN